jgi:paraquat-inducible protein B
VKFPRKHPRVVGTFVLGAIVIVLAAVVVLSSGELFVRKDRFSLYFPGSVAGLNPGSPVNFRGIKVGSVKEVEPWATDSPDQPIQIEVVIEIRPDRVKVPRGAASPYEKLDTAGLANLFIAHGLRARLVSQSLLTGQKQIELDFAPKDPARYAAVVRRYPELPTTPTGIERLGDRAEVFLDKVADLPLDEMLDDLHQSIHGLKEITNSADLRATLVETRSGAKEMAPTLVELRTAVSDLRTAMESMRGEIAQTGGQGRQTMQQAQQTLQRTQQTLAQLEDTLHSTDETRMQAARALDEMERTMKALHALAEYIQLHPESVVMGKEKKK